MASPLPAATEPSEKRRRYCEVLEEAMVERHEFMQTMPEIVYGPLNVIKATKPSADPATAAKAAELVATLELAYAQICELFGEEPKEFDGPEEDDEEE